MINSRDTDELTPLAKMYAIRFLNEAAVQNIPVLITCTYRDNEYQDHLYAQGRTRPGNKVTKAKGGQSAHNYRVAFDFVPLDVFGRADWNNLDAFKKLGAIGKKVGLDWGGNWTSFVDMPHMQVPNFKIPTVTQTK